MIRNPALAIALASAAALGALAAPAPGRELPLSARNSFRIGDSGVLCTAQAAPGDPRLKQMFDRGYTLNCRDAAGAVGTLVALRRSESIAGLPSAMPGIALACTPAGRTAIDGVGAVETADCTSATQGIGYRRYLVERGGVTYVVEGLSGYDPALRLALATVVTGQPAAGKVEVAATEVSDAAAFARIQAGALDRLDARDEAYIRNNSGRFAESGEFFESLVGREKGDSAALAEVLANQALQQSNLGNFSAARRLLDAAAEAAPRGDGVAQRLIRNYRAIDRLNAKQPDQALAVLTAKVAEIDGGYGEDALRRGIIEVPLAVQINRENAALREIGGVESGLTVLERAELLDAQGLALEAMAHRRLGDTAKAIPMLKEATARIAKVRGGRVVSARWLRAEIGMEQGLIAEQAGDVAGASAAFDRAILAIGESFPDSPALLAARARKAGLLARAGNIAEARAQYGAIVGGTGAVFEDTAILRELLQPYFGLLATAGDGAAASEMFLASQLLQRPGVAQTQAVLAREMSEGNDEASAMFRLSVNRSRDIARTSADVAVLSGLAAPTAAETARLAGLKETLGVLQAEQTALLAKLADYPRYKALAPQQLQLADLKASLKPGEAYYKLVVLGDQAYGLWVSPDATQTFAIPGGVAAIEDDVRTIRDSIAVKEGGQVVTYPFDIERSRQLFTRLFGPVEGMLGGVKHLVFEPDGPMLQLPPQVLVTSDRSVTDYKARVAKPKGDEYDFTGTDWLAKGRAVSIAVSPRGFMDLRKIAPSSAPKAYLGLGTNAPPPATFENAAADPCAWGLGNWRQPIPSGELYAAQKDFGAGASEVRTGAAFTDTALLADPTVGQYRILHFATHGLVTAPKPSCPARPALITSFGGEGSDGLLSFSEIFDLKLDADLVILSACDTAGMATVSATREAGISTGGNYALDGLVRAFVGAGARSVVASHWPVPEEFNATQRLISGMLEASPGEGLAESLEKAQESLMAVPESSHPFYWAAFIILGDGARPLRN